jgi:hypothetical protein
MPLCLHPASCPRLPGAAPPSSYERTFPHMGNQNGIWKGVGVAKANRARGQGPRWAVPRVREHARLHCAAVPRAWLSPEPNLRAGASWKDRGHKEHFSCRRGRASGDQRMQGLFTQFYDTTLTIFFNEQTNSVLFSQRSSITQI